MSKPIARIAVLLALAAPVSCGGGAESTGAPSGQPEEETAKYNADGCLAAQKVEPGAICVRTLQARVVDLAGVPLPNLVTTACGDGCTFGKTDPNGLTRMDVRRYMRKAAIMLHGRSRYASYYSRFEAAGDVDQGQLLLPIMPFEEGADLPKDGQAKTVAHGDVTFAFGAGAEVKIDGIELETDQEQRFRAVHVALDKAPPFVDKAAGFAAIYALTPFHTRIAPAASVTLANTTKLPAGAAVEFFIQGAELDEKHGPFGLFNKIADGHVSADGATIRTDEGQGVPEITWLGVRLKR